MTNALVGAVIAGTLVFGYALVGEALLCRSSRDLFGWNESFLIGSGACAAALFPLTLLAPSSALNAEFGLLVLAALVVGWSRLRRRRPWGPRPWSGELTAIAKDPVAAVLFLGILGVVAFFAALNLWRGHSWDSVQVWGTKAQRLYYEGGLSRRWFFEDPYDVRILSYPPLISFFEAAYSRLRGAFDFDRLKPIFLYFYLSMLAGTYAAVRSVCSRRWALAMVLLVALLPELSTGLSAGGYVDIPLAAFVAATVAAGFRREGSRPDWRSPLPWLLGAMTTVKQEGMILALVGCGAIVLAWWTERPRRLAARIRSEWSGGAVILAFVAGRVSYVRWIGVHDATWGPLDATHAARVVENTRVIASTCLRLLLDPRIWGLFWPAFFVSAGLALLWRDPRPAILAVATTAAIVVDASVFLLTNWDLRVHIEGAYTRLLAQVAPAAAVVIGFAASRIWSGSRERMA